MTDTMMANSSTFDCDSGEYWNLTNSASAKNALYSTSEKIIIGIAMPCVLGIGVIANLAFLFVIFRVSYMRTTTNFYLAILALSDICFLSVTILEKMTAYTASPVSGDSRFESSVGCVFYAMTVYIAYFSSLGLITLVSLERYFALCSPVRHRQFRGRKHTLRLVVFNFIISVILAACVTLGFSTTYTVCILWSDEVDFLRTTRKGAFDSVEELPTTYEYCGPLNERLENIGALQLIPFPLAFVGNTIMYWRIIRSLSNRPSSNQTKVADQNRQARNQVAWMLVINGLIFFLCNLPFILNQSIQLLSSISGVTYIEGNASRVFVWIGRLGTYTNSAANPFIFTTMSKRYRQAYRKAFKCTFFSKACCRKRDKTMEVFSTMTVVNGRYIQERDENSFL